MESYPPSKTLELSQLCPGQSIQLTPKQSILSPPSHTHSSHHLLTIWFVLRPIHINFNHLASAIHWILLNNYNVTHLLHYLDDFLTAGSPGSLECQQNLDCMLQLCHCINAPIKLENVVSPTTLITCLYVTGFAKRYLFHTQNLTHFLNFKAS